MPSGIDATHGDFLHKEYPKRFSKTDFWRQIKRTVNGQPVAESDIELIVRQITTHLQLDSDDHLLDLGCGNGALAARLFDRTARYTGVDFSECLLDVADEFFRPHDGIAYIQSDIRKTAAFHSAAANATKVLIYGCICYLSKPEVQQLLVELRQRFPRVQRIMIGNVADREKSDEFFAARNICQYELDDPQSAIGVWWSREELTRGAERLGYQATIVTMPPEFYGSKYRFDVVMHRDAS